VSQAARVETDIFDRWASGLQPDEVRQLLRDLGWRELAASLRGVDAGTREYFEREMTPGGRWSLADDLAVERPTSEEISRAREHAVLLVDSLREQMR
jgi:hypothetical protein